jgi:hypothetical protein
MAQPCYCTFTSQQTSISTRIAAAAQSHNNPHMRHASLQAHKKPASNNRSSAPPAHIVHVAGHARCRKQRACDAGTKQAARIWVARVIALMPQLRRQCRQHRFTNTDVKRSNLLMQPYVAAGECMATTLKQSHKTTVAQYYLRRLPTQAQNLRRVSCSPALIVSLRKHCHDLGHHQVLKQTKNEVNNPKAVETQSQHARQKQVSRMGLHSNC